MKRQIDLITTDEVADMLRLNRKYTSVKLNKLAARGKVRQYRLTPDSNPRYDRNELIQMLAEPK